ncbi:MAG: phage holin family protein [Actinomycetota bacterium]|nr:phage holin family protein [Actinomycetota bacterium]
MAPVAGPDPRAQDLNKLLLPVEPAGNGSSQPKGEVIDASSAAPREELRDQPISDVVKQVSDDASTLVRQEIRLAKAEMTEKAKQVGVGAGMLGAAGYLSALATLALMLCLIFVLATFLPAWLAALIVTLVFLAAAGALAVAGKTRIKKAGPPVPEQAVESVKQTIETVKEDAKWGLNQTR